MFILIQRNFIVKINLKTIKDKEFPIKEIFKPISNLNETIKLI